MIESILTMESAEMLRTGDVAIPSGDSGLRPVGEGEPTSLDRLLADFERQAIVGALRRAGGGRSLAARRLGISRSRLYRRMDALGIDPDAAQG